MATIERVAFLGLGLMGDPMAATLRRAGFELMVYNRSVGKARAFAEKHGVRAVESPAELAPQVDAVVTMVRDGDAVEQVLTGPGGITTAARGELLCVDCSTIGPDAAHRIGQKLAQRGLAFVDAPVSGSVPKAGDGTLTMMVGGSVEDVGRARPLLDALGELVVHVGELGQGQLVKVISNAMAAANVVTAGQAMLLARQGGVDLDAFLRVVPGTAGGSTMLRLKAGAMREHDYTTLFRLDQLLKDVRLCLDRAQTAGTPFNEAAEARQWLAAASGRGHGDDDFAAVIEALEAAASRRL